ncbi:MAG TPA: DUF3795 domain-containing protein [Dehalococcoidales bacterium]|nr:DUF3795 domain-containing protein [Dehalococcoidales bacterium]
MLKTGVCGDDCNYCPRYMATLSGNEERLKDVAKMWVTAGWRKAEDAVEKIKCRGCGTVKACGLGVKDCAAEKRVESCGECRDYPCEKMAKIFEGNQKEAPVCKKALTDSDYWLFQKAFFSKKARLDIIREELNR